MLRTLGAIVFLVLAYTVLVLAAGHLPSDYAAAAAFLVPLIGLAAAWRAIRAAQETPLAHYLRGIVARNLRSESELSSIRRMRNGTCGDTVGAGMERLMSAVQAFVLGITVALTPSLIVLGWVLRKVPVWDSLDEAEH
jgi:hypothetical protein